MEQTKQLQDSFMPEKFRVLSGSALKVLAMVIMLNRPYSCISSGEISGCHQDFICSWRHGYISLQDHAGCGQGCIPHFLFSSGGGLCPYTQPL